MTLEGRTEILVIFGRHFGRNDDLINSFWIWLTYSKGPLYHISKYLSIDQLNWINIYFASTYTITTHFLKWVLSNMNVWIWNLKLVFYMILSMQIKHQRWKMRQRKIWGAHLLVLDLMQVRFSRVLMKFSFPTQEKEI